jgi:hypothetical protein
MQLCNLKLLSLQLYSLLYLSFAIARLINSFNDLLAKSRDEIIEAREPESRLAILNATANLGQGQHASAKSHVEIPIALLQHVTEDLAQVVCLLQIFQT